jgi:hypothetical protein
VFIFFILSKIKKIQETRHKAQTETLRHLYVCRANFLEKVLVNFENILFLPLSHDFQVATLGSIDGYYGKVMTVRKFIDGNYLTKKE